MNRVRILIASGVVLVLLAIGLVVVLTRSSSNHGANPSPTSSTGTTTTTTTTTTTSASPTASSGSPELGKKFILGAFAGSEDHSSAGQIAAVGNLERATGVQLGIVHVYRTLDEPFNTPFIEKYAHSDKSLLLSWAGGDTKKMADGSLDATIRQRAVELKALGVPVLFEYRWEMDRPNLQAKVVHSPADYIAAWKRIHSIFASEKVTNAQFVWCPLAKGFVSGTAQKYYPGDDEVNWICADVYPNGIKPAPTFASLTAPFLSWAAAHPQPIMFGEFGISTKYTEAERASWLSGIPAVVQAHSRIMAAVYFNASAPNYSTALGTDTKVLAAFKSLSR